ncbi:tetratricopeptide repeat protein [Streptomyces zhihengii]|uniref:tetratricopeptide repeat protein n=1 Tax=Streptomyces zhihengii TaxID=1818004 RepID=UPI0035575D56
MWTEAVDILIRLGETALADGHAPQATQLYQRALTTCTERASPRGEARTQTGLALAARLRGDEEAARHHLNRAPAKNRCCYLGCRAGDRRLRHVPSMFRA